MTKNLVFIVLVEVVAIFDHQVELVVKNGDQFLKTTVNDFFIFDNLFATTLEWMHRYSKILHPSVHSLTSYL